MSKTTTATWQTLSTAQGMSTLRREGLNLSTQWLFILLKLPVYKQENPPTRHLDPKRQELPRPCPIIPLTGLSFWASTAPQKQATQPASKPYQAYTQIKKLGEIRNACLQSHTANWLFIPKHGLSRSIVAPVTRSTSPPGQVIGNVSRALSVKCNWAGRMGTGTHTSQGP